MGRMAAVKPEGKLVYLAFFAILFSLLFSRLCSAGGVNDSEQGVVAAAGGTFEWEGNTYRAKQGYIDSLVAYLSGDDVDLDAADCQAAIQKMYENIGRGVAEGYLVRTDSQNESGAVASGSEAGGAEPGKQADGAGSGSEAGGTKPEYQPAGTEFENNSAETEPEPTSLPAGTVCQTQTPYAVYNPLSFQTESLIDRTAWQPYSWIIGKTWLFGNGISDSRLTAERWSVPYVGIERIIYTVCILLASLILKAGFELWRKKRRVKFFGITKKAVFAASAFGWAVIMGTLALYLSVMHRDAAVNLVERTAFYEDTARTVEADRKEIAGLLGLPGLFPEDGTLYSKAMIQARQQTIAALNQTESTPDYGVLLDGFEAAVRGRTGDKAASLLTVCLEKRYEKLLVWDGASWWIEESAHFNRFVRRVFIPATFLLLASNGFLILSHTHRYRGVRSCAYSLACPAFLFLLISAVLWLLAITGVLWGNRTGADEFTRLGLQNLALIGMGVGAIAACISKGVLEAARYLKKNK